MNKACVLPYKFEYMQILEYTVLGNSKLAPCALFSISTWDYIHTYFNTYIFIYSMHKYKK